ncbi:MAG: hypothetical protein VW338_17555 [Rhodospirillaceae bacterium]
MEHQGRTQAFGRVAFASGGVRADDAGRLAAGAAGHFGQYGKSRRRRTQTPHQAVIGDGADTRRADQPDAVDTFVFRYKNINFITHKV